MSDDSRCDCFHCNIDRDIERPWWEQTRFTRMIVCPTCGYKRCPHATHHDNPCTGSNTVGQPGSRYGKPSGERATPAEIIRLIVADMDETERHEPFCAFVHHRGCCDAPYDCDAKEPRQ